MDKNSAESTLEFFFLRLSYWLETSRKFLLLIKPAASLITALRLQVNLSCVWGLVIRINSDSSKFLIFEGKHTKGTRQILI